MVTGHFGLAAGAEEIDDLPGTDGSYGDVMRSAPRMRLNVARLWSPG